jgi:two-component system, NarL family, response regulator NreC
MMVEIIRIVLVDDHDIVRTGLRSFLEAQGGLLVVGEARDGFQALQIVQDQCPDVVVMDITMPRMDGLEATRKLKGICPQVHVLALTVHEDKQYFFEMLAAGATGYMTKQAAADELVSAIHAVAQGYVYLQPTLARWLLDDYRRLAELTQWEESPLGSDFKTGEEKDLSKRERQVLELVADGKTTPQISQLLGISPKTVARHRERIMNKLNLHSAAELVKFAIRKGIIEI